MVVYAFDVDETLEVSKGPVKLFELAGASDDRGAAERAGWRFIRESEFAKRRSVKGCACASRVSGRDDETWGVPEHSFCRALVAMATDPTFEWSTRETQAGNYSLKRLEAVLA